MSNTTTLRSQNHPHLLQRIPKSKAGRRNPKLDAEEEFSDIGETALDWLDYYSKDGGQPFQPISNRNQKFTTRLRPSPLEERQGKENMSMPKSAIRQSLRVAATGTTKTTDKRYRATVEQAIDPRTRLVLFQILNRAIFDDINGCISTGKQANVYHATKHDGQEFAVKVYKTPPVLGFKDWDPYIQGDNRFRHDYCKHNPWKTVKTWAEKEMSILMRLKAAGIRCPTPILLKLHVLVMEFIGKSGCVAPRLKDANLSEDKMRECYVQMIMVMRNLYQKCKLVHEDLSEYILYYEGNLHIVDVSESVDLDHPLASDVLRKGCKNVTDFFKMNCVGVMTRWELFDFIVDSSITDESVECYLEKIQQKILARGGVMSAEDKKLYISRELDQEEDTVDFMYIITAFEHSLFPAQEQLRMQPKEWDTNDTFADQTDFLTNSGTESGTDGDDDSSDTTKKDGTQETLSADKEAARKENKEVCSEWESEGKEYMSMPKSDKRDRASVEQAIDPRTRIVLFKMLNQAIFDDINGCVSTGKQANVYHATKHDGQEFAVKVYESSSQGFKDRNPRKMVKTRAEKEMRNLMRLKAAGIRCPTPILSRFHVLVMEFIGKSGWAAPRLKDANLSEDKMRECYVQMIMVMRNLYQKCKLVHGDLSEYNVLFYEGNLHIIDVSRSVDLDDPFVLDVLREDCTHVTNFFEKNGVGVMPIGELHDFIVDSSIAEESVECYLDEVKWKYLARGNVLPVEDKAADWISWKEAEEDVNRIASGQDNGDLKYVTVLKQIPKQPKESDTNGVSTEQTNKFGTLCGTVIDGQYTGDTPCSKKSSSKREQEESQKREERGSQEDSPKGCRK
ncbi:hypothetical protein MKW92_006349 [Papaver armeniacum]|nr:hypothetical protein MKW92_006349 [Papaver armeniacum]